jgi:glutathione-regulated potassium-efflux system ancillary protein KefF
VTGAGPTPVVVIYAHPHPDRSHAGRPLLDAVRHLRGVAVHALYDRYADFAIDVGTERAALQPARLIVWQHPLYWYTAPALLKLWFESVLGPGWAYGDGGRALAGKHCLWVVTTGAPAAEYTSQGAHGCPFEAFVPVVRQTARYCGMHWLEPVVLHAADHASSARIAAVAADYRDRLAPFLPDRKESDD